VKDKIGTKINWGSNEVLFIVLFFGIVLSVIGFTGRLLEVHSEGEDITRAIIDFSDTTGKVLLAIWFGLYMQKRFFSKKSPIPQLKADNNRGTCPFCGHTYLSSDYSKEASLWLCSNCKSEIPKI